MTPGTKRLAGIGCVVLLVAYSISLVVFFKTMPARLAASNDLRSRIKWTTSYSNNFSVGFHISDRGKIYSAGYGGEITCMDHDGNLEWISTSPKNSYTFWRALGFGLLDDGRLLAISNQPNSSVTSPGRQFTMGGGNLELQIIDANGATEVDPRGWTVILGLYSIPDGVHAA